MKLIASIVAGLLFHSVSAYAQIEGKAAKEIERRSSVWNVAYNSRDSLGFYTLFDSLALLSSAGARWVGKEECKRLCRGLYKRRPDITWYNTPSRIEVNDQWSVAYETGEWVEAWTETGDTDKSQIKGKYWVMWHWERDDWFITSAVFTPLSCTGSYCVKKR